MHCYPAQGAGTLLHSCTATPRGVRVHSSAYLDLTLTLSTPVFMYPMLLLSAKRSL